MRSLAVMDLQSVGVLVHCIEAANIVCLWGRTESRRYCMLGPNALQTSFPPAILVPTRPGRLVGLRVDLRSIAQPFPYSKGGWGSTNSFTSQCSNPDNGGLNTGGISHWLRAG